MEEKEIQNSELFISIRQSINLIAEFYQAFANMSSYFKSMTELFLSLHPLLDGR